MTEHEAEELTRLAKEYHEKYVKTPEQARSMLVEAGICNEEGELIYPYK